MTGFVLSDYVVVVVVVSTVVVVVVVTGAGRGEARTWTCCTCVCTCVDHLDWTERGNRSYGVLLLDGEKRTERERDGADGGRTDIRLVVRTYAVKPTIVSRVHGRRVRVRRRTN